MRLARDSRYAIEALVVLASMPVGDMMEAREIADVAHLPAPFLSKIMRSLALGGVLRSQRGKGYVLARPAEDIVLDDVLRAVEGEDVIWDACIFWREECDTKNPCPLHFRWQDLKPGIQGAMGSITLSEIAERGLQSESEGGTLRGPRGS